MANFEPTSVNIISRWRRALHWLSALAVVGAAGVAITMTDLDVSTPAAAASATTWYSSHKALGAVVLILTLIRLFSMSMGSRVTHQ